MTTFFFPEISIVSHNTFQSRQRTVRSSLATGEPPEVTSTSNKASYSNQKPAVCVSLDNRSPYKSLQHCGLKKGGQQFCDRRRKKNLFIRQI